MDYIYGASGVTGFKYNGNSYIYRKNVQGDITAILDNSGNVVVRYVYDAWGNHKVCNPDGTENTSNMFLGNLNPLRYRSYYYDTATGLYYLQSRYYDPQVGRFLNADSIDNLDPESINGLNLYTYCENNPVNMVDPDGQWAWLATIWAGIKAAAKAVWFAICHPIQTLQKLWGLIKWVGRQIASGIRWIGSKIGEFFSKIKIKWQHRSLAKKSAQESIKYYADAGKDGVLIGNDMTTLHSLARTKNLGVMQGLDKGIFHQIETKFGLEFADKISLMYNKEWIKAVMKNNLKVFRFGITAERKFLQLELKLLGKAKYPIIPF